MKKLIPIALLLLTSGAVLQSCNKGDDNPYGDWKCVCFLEQKLYNLKDTVVLYENDMDRNTAKAFCEKAKQGYIDSSGTTADCNIK